MREVFVMNFDYESEEKFDCFVDAIICLLIIVIVALQVILYVRTI